MTSDDQDKNVASHTFGAEDDSADNAVSDEIGADMQEHDGAPQIHPSLLKAQQVSMDGQSKTATSASEETTQESAAQIHPSLQRQQLQSSENMGGIVENGEAEVVDAAPQAPRTTTVSLKKEDLSASITNTTSPATDSVVSTAATEETLADDFDDLDEIDDGSYDDLDDESFDSDLQDEIDAVSTLGGSYDSTLGADVSDLNEEGDMPKVPAAVMGSSSPAKLKAMIGGGALLVLLAGGAFVFMGADEQIKAKPAKVASVADQSYKAPAVESAVADMAETEDGIGNAVAAVNASDISEELAYDQEEDYMAGDDTADILPVTEDDEEDIVAETEGDFELPETELALPAIPAIEENVELPVSGQELAAEDVQEVDQRFAFDAPLDVTTKTDTEMSSQVDVQMFGMDLPQPSAQQNKIGRFEPNKPSAPTLTQDFPTDGGADLPQPQIEQLLPTQEVPPKPENGRTLLSEGNGEQGPVIDPNEPPIAVLTKPQAQTTQTEVAPEPTERAAVNPVPTSGVIKGTRGGEGGVDNDDEIQAKITEFFDSGSERAGASPFSGIRKVDPSEEPASRFVIVKKRHEASAEEALLVSANRALRLKRYDSALDMFDVLYQKNSRDPRILMGLGVAQQNTGRHDSAFRTYEQVLEVDPKNKEALLNMMGLLKEKYPAVALRRLAEMREAHPDNAQIVAQIGLVSAKIGDYETAMRNLGVAASLEPKNAMHLYNMAIVADRQRQVSNAIKLYQRALEVDSMTGGKALPRDKVYDRLSKLRRRL